MARAPRGEEVVADVGERPRHNRPFPPVAKADLSLATLGRTTLVTVVARCDPSVHGAITTVAERDHYQELVGG